MKYLKLFEEMNVKRNEFPFQGHDLSPREKKILIDLVGDEYLYKFFLIKVEDHYYYTCHRAHYNIFENFNELKDYILLNYYIYSNNPEELLKLLMGSKTDPSLDDNRAIGSAIIRYRHLTNLNNRPIYKEIVKLLLNDERVKSKLSEKEIYKYTNEIS